MAEALGVAASAISILTLTAQIIDSIDKLRAIHTFVKTASVEFEDLLAEIEIIQAVLRTLTPEMLMLLNLPSAERRLQVFHQDLEILILKVSKYKSSADRKLGAVKLVLKRETFRIQRQNLDNLKSTLSLLQLACYHASLSQPSSRVLRQNESPDCQEDNSNTCRQVARRTDSIRKSKKWYRNEYRIRTPLFFVDRLWTIAVTNLHGWQLTLQVNNVVPVDSPIFASCRLGEIEEVRRLFSTCRASPFDCGPRGESLLHVAAGNGQVDMCRFLLENGCRPDQRDGNGHSPLSSVNEYILDVYNPPGQKPVTSIGDLYQLFLNEAEDTFFENYAATDLTQSYYGFSGPEDVLKLLQNHSFDAYSELPLQFRFQRAIAVNTRWYCKLSPDVLKVAMGGGCIDHAAYLLEDIDGETLLHKIAQGMGTELGVNGSAGAAGWYSLLSDAISAHPDVCKISYRFTRPKTPLMDFLTCYALSNFLVMSGQCWFDFDMAIEIWVSILKRAGVDLEAYGAAEDSLFRSIARSPIPAVASDGSFGDTGSLPSSRDFLTGDVLGLRYGPEPEDWHLWVTNPIDELVGEFWEMVQRSLEVMPGTWID
ncbi:hypothetical protein BJY00DRAFT_296984 [Aspergillus carlsbadensis]|nr:hypothetical protein BJY00DRAFT_296984 [Aspergillus carlsbadensis]